MSVAAGVVSAVLCLVLAEVAHILLAKVLRSMGLPYEIQHLPLFLILLIALYIVYKVFLFPPAINVLMKFGILYGGIGASLLILLALIRQLHYQTYVFILNWFKKE